jgi:lipid II:glycine glycyltransferase (peptidoglycan interpeptide bridge formation enzyme)
MPEVLIPEWESFLDEIPDEHLMQTSNWGKLKSDFGWDVARIIANNDATQRSNRVGAQILFRRLPLGFTIAYIPKGPVCAQLDSVGCLESDTLWSEVDSICKKRKSIFLRVEPDSWQVDAEPSKTKQEQKEASHMGFSRGEDSIQPSRTLLVDIKASEDQILGRMKQKTRYNIRLAIRKGVIVHSSSDLDVFHKLMVVTGGRDAFGIHSIDYYQKAYDLFHPRGECEIFMAEFDGEPMATLMVFARGKRAWYFYGASDNKHREKMSPYLLQWTAMRWARSKGCALYDLWGVPDEDEDTLEANFTARSGGLWGVYRFKRGFGGQLRRAHGPWDRVYQPVLYTFYRWWTSVRKKHPN